MAYVPQFTDNLHRTMFRSHQPQTQKSFHLSKTEESTHILLFCIALGHSVIDYEGSLVHFQRWCHRRT